MGIVGRGFALAGAHQSTAIVIGGTLFFLD